MNPFDFGKIKGRTPTDGTRGRRAPLLFEREKEREKERPYQSIGCVIVVCVALLP